MKFFVTILCFLVAFATAQDCQGQRQRDILSQGTCNSESSVLCRDPCGGALISGAENCTVSYCCLNSQEECVLKQARNIATTTQTVDASAFVAQLQNANNGNIGGDDDDDDENENTIRTGLGLFPPGLSPFCPTFPYNCPVPNGPHLDFSAPFNIPYCQRIACSASNPFLDSNYQACISQPGCYFDLELYGYRSVVGQAVLPGVPVCHSVIRNKAFQRRASEAAQALGSWNPLITVCLLNEYDDEIFGEHVGCQFLDYLDYFGHSAKRAGWTSITQRECNLIGACWRRSSTGSYCAYPADSRGQPTVRSSNDERQSAYQSADLYGLPSCSPFSAAATGADFLASYHTCLSSGCAVNVDREALWENLISTGSNLTYPTNIQYITMIYSGQVRPDNYKSILEQLTNTPVFPSSYQPVAPYPSLPNHGFGNIIPFPFNANDNRFFQLPTGNAAGGYGSSVPTFPSGGLGHPQFPIGGGSNFPTGGFGGPGYPVFPAVFPPVNPCPYQSQQLYYPGLPQLTGSFSGCCDKPLCYTPKPDLYDTNSGISSYLYQWSAWSKCSATCGGGLKNRTRDCIGDHCSSNALRLQTQVCNENDCPYYMPWGQWSDCSATCGGGTKTRSRVCAGSGECNGPSTESDHCRRGACPTYEYGQWSSCSNTCGRGTRTRTRVCNNRGAYGCPPNTVDQEACEQFCGTSRLQCNPTTCCYEEQCRQADGSRGYCATSHNPLIGHRCRVGQCLYRYQVSCSGSNSLPLDLFSG